MEKKRLTLTGNKMPDEVYKKLEELGNQRKLTPYIVALIEKEETMNKLIENLPVLTSKVDNVEHILSNLNQNTEIPLIQKDVETIKSHVEEIVQEGKLAISDKIKGGIDEEVEEVDF